MKPSLLSIAPAVLAAAAFAQGGPHGPPVSRGNVLDMAKLQTIEGKITTIDIAYGVQYPSIVVAQQQIKVAPVWFFLENDFELSIGQAVKVTVAPSPRATDPYLYAIKIEAGNASLLLRDTATGVPLWSMRMYGGPSTPPQVSAGTGCVDPQSLTLVAGVIDKLSAGLGIQFPSMVLQTDRGLITLKLAPERILMAADLELSPGSRVTVKYGFETCTGEYLALQITDQAGRTVILRNDDGSPAWN
ncbi:MAG: hypothetical protein LC126_25400 [Bryobacterales bacterium]|nr:hypothetical protein [Bryobacterales bacterium]